MAFGPELSEYERERQEKIAKNQALLRSLALEASSTGLAPTSSVTKSRNSTSSTSRRSGRHSTGTTDGQGQSTASSTDRKRDRKAKEGAKRYVEESLSLPRRTSSRLRGIVADSEVAKRKAQEENEALAEAERAKRRRISGDLRLGDVIVSNMRKGGGGVVSGAAMKGWDGIGLSGVLGPARPNERTYFGGLEKNGGEDGDQGTVTDKGLRALREKMGGLRLWDGFEPNRIKITPERIYSLGFHPTPEKPLVFAGDKLGNLGLCDCSQTSVSSSSPARSPSAIKRDPDDDEGKGRKKAIKNESDEGGDDGMNDEEDFEEAEPAITTFKIHTRTISAFKFAPTDSNMLYSASYDSSIRKLDLAKGVSVEVYATGDDEPVTAIDMAPNDPNTMYFTTIEGRFGIYDMRSPSSSSPSGNVKTETSASLDSTSSGGSLREILSLSDKKIGGFSLHPQQPHFVATASLDRMVKVWDLRKINGRDDWRLPALLGEHESRLSVSHASFNGVGQVSTASYDDTIKIYDFWGSSKAGAGAGAGAGDWKVGASLSAQRMEPSVVIPHNNQTGRWVTILRAQWQEAPPATPSGKTGKEISVVQRFCIGNMNRFVDIYTADGHQIGQLGDDSGEGRITAVPAVARFHPSVDWVAAGTASGKLCLWM